MNIQQFSELPFSKQIELTAIAVQNYINEGNVVSTMNANRCPAAIVAKSLGYKRTIYDSICLEEISDFVLRCDYDDNNFVLTGYDRDNRYYETDEEFHLSTPESLFYASKQLLEAGY